MNDEILRRRDMRADLTFTIDPDDAKDFDDALSFMEQEDGTYLIGVHIADVTHYVPIGSDIDLEAYELGTSTYLVDRVLPMLPERLCNDLCSLRPHEDKLCMSVVFTIGRDARVLKHKVCRTVIHSDYRLTYHQAQALLDGGEGDAELIHALHELNFLAKTMRRQRMAHGALDIEQEQTHFTLDEHGHPTDIWFETMTDANHLIEEFMLLANRTVATQVGLTGKEFVYRVHDKPDAMKMAALERFKHRVGERLPAATIELLTIRAMAKAVYSTHNIGHYGLAFDYYTHFTSPIRRYPDMMVHRLVARYILGERGKTMDIDLEEACDHCSAMEQAAAMAERDSVKDYQMLWLQDHINEEFDGIITGVTDFGFFVNLNETHCEGLVPLRTLGLGEHWQYDERQFCLRSRASHRRYTLGDSVRVKLVRADLEMRQIDFELVE